MWVSNHFILFERFYVLEIGLSNNYHNINRVNLGSLGFSIRPLL